MKQIFTSENIRFVEVSERLVQDYLIMVNDIEHVEKFIGGWHEPFTEEQEIRWVQKKLAEKVPVFSMLEKKSGRFAPRKNEKRGSAPEKEKQLP